MPKEVDPHYQYSPNLRSEVSAFLPANYQKVLEVGCSYGTFRKNLEQANEYWGIEPNVVVANEASQHLDKVLSGLFEEVLDQLPDAYFDLVICNDVIEHMADPDQFLELIKLKMCPGASLVGSIPNVRHISNLKGLLIQKDWQYEDAGILDRTHLKFFTQKSLKNLFLRHGFRIDKISGINDISSRAFFPRVFARLLYLILGDDIRYVQIGFRVNP
ncbi:class I SAM-dependent methyltransferase [Polynucleobacter sp. MG-28-Ekke-A2]|uniref:class I SAM-dependent methyltransferase n=1 Tax=Polynucleobacter sp. MG-28-Ekke-A2 TaxID=3108276 RepID=UPI002B23D8CB|nr:class I SAM-dependent methyltransferase [Polynucleobacter sp. MG-28-Ekke-A2]MEA9601100.1 class I SAM-dependent methyltransferase [Polynucleobacter sp. MG-28-Ekke-A2]